MRSTRRVPRPAESRNAPADPGAAPDRSAPARFDPAQPLFLSPHFVLLHAFDGAPYFQQDAHPFTRMDLSEHSRALALCFSTRTAIAPATVVDAFLAREGFDVRGGERAACLACVEDMLRGGILVRSPSSLARYTSAMADAYDAQRQVPTELGDAIARQGAVGRATRVLDMATGTGSLAVQLARRSGRVSALDVSRDFLAVARRRARAAGVAVRLIHESCNRLAYHAATYDVVTVSQAFHWLDPVQASVGLHRVVGDGGRFFYINTETSLAATHPLRQLLADARFGATTEASFRRTVEREQRALTRLFDVAYVGYGARFHVPRAGYHADPPRLRPTGLRLFAQARRFDLAFARAYFSDQHLAEMKGLRSPSAFWSELERRTRACDPCELTGTMYWSLQEFRKLPGRASATPLRAARTRVVRI